MHKLKKMSIFASTELRIDNEELTGMKRMLSITTPPSSRPASGAAQFLILSSSLLASCPPPLAVTIR
jgi:hypothetical protein